MLKVALQSTTQPGQAFSCPLGASIRVLSSARRSISSSTADGILTNACINGCISEWVSVFSERLDRWKGLLNEPFRYIDALTYSGSWSTATWVSVLLFGAKALARNRRGCQADHLRSSSLLLRCQMSRQSIPWDFHIHETRRR